MGRTHRGDLPAVGRRGDAESRPARAAPGAEFPPFPMRAASCAWLKTSLDCGVRGNAAGLLAECVTETMGNGWFLSAPKELICAVVASGAAPFAPSLHFSSFLLPCSATLAQDGLTPRLEPARVRAGEMLRVEARGRPNSAVVIAASRSNSGLGEFAGQPVLLGADAFILFACPSLSSCPRKARSYSSPATLTPRARRSSGPSARLSSHWSGWSGNQS